MIEKSSHLKSVDPCLSGVLLLNEYHNVKDFDCGEDVPNTFLKEYALINQRKGRSRVFVVCRGQEVVGFYSLTAAEIHPEKVFKDVLKGLPQKAPVPAVLLGQLAVDTKEQGKKLGQALLKDALKRCCEISEEIGIRVVFVHALNSQVKKFYETFGFKTSPAEPYTMMVLIRDIKQYLN